MGDVSRNLDNKNISFNILLNFRHEKFRKFGILVKMDDGWLTWLQATFIAYKFRKVAHHFGKHSSLKS